MDVDGIRCFPSQHLRTNRLSPIFVRHPKQQMKSHTICAHTLDFRKSNTWAGVCTQYPLKSGQRISTSPFERYTKRRLFRVQNSYYWSTQYLATSVKWVIKITWITIYVTKLSSSGSGKNAGSFSLFSPFFGGLFKNGEFLSESVKTN